MIFNSNKGSAVKAVVVLEENNENGKGMFQLYQLPLWLRHFQNDK